jgi:hypothetical protein
MRWERVRALLVAAAAAASVMATSCQGAEQPPPPPPAPSPGLTPPAAPAPQGPGPPVLGVKIDNAEAARPPVGLGAANLVFVEPVEGGLSRLLAVYSDRKPNLVGPVRSARETDLQILPQFGRPTLAFSGAAPELLPLIDRSPVENASDGKVPAAYTRNPTREAPHNLFVHPAQLPQGGPWAPQSALQFGPPPGGGSTTGPQQVQYPSATVGFEWSPEGWLVSMDGQRYSSDEGPLHPSTVVLQRVGTHQSMISDVAGKPSPVAETVGNGTAQVLREGKVFDAKWSRPNPESPTTYTTTTGEPLPFAPGQVWIVLTES